MAIEKYRDTFRKVATIDVLRRLILLKLCSWNWVANNAGELILGSKALLGDTWFRRLFKPMVYDIFVAGDSQNEISNSMNKLHMRRLTPFLSPMLEDDPGRQVSQSRLVHEANFGKIGDCIDIVSKMDCLSTKSIAIKLTAFVPPGVLSDICKDFNLFENDLITKDHVHRIDQAMNDSNQTTTDMAMASKKLRKIADLCHCHGINLYVDAEYSHLQPAVRLMTLALMLRYNRIHSSSLIYNTYQCYLKRSLDQFGNDIELAEELGIPLASKLVRGAYLVMERSKLNCPVHKTYEDTNTSYNKAVELGFQFLITGLNVTIATHNQQSIEMAVEKLLLHPPSQRKQVNFAQINGLGDHLSMMLADNGQEVLKLLPCGTVDEVLPWLGRRLQENNVARDRVMVEKDLLTNELISRLVPMGSIFIRR